MKGKMLTPFKKDEMRRERRNRGPYNIIIAIHKDTGKHRIGTVGFDTQEKGLGVAKGTEKSQRYRKD